MKLDNLSTFGQKFVVEPSGTSLTDDEKHLLNELKPQGIMFRKRNFLQGQDYSTWLSAYRNLLDECREVIGRDKLLVCVDHEGGRVIRPPLPITRFPYAARWADQVVPVARAMAVELKSLGINVNFAPVADIHSNPENPVINERAFGRTAKEVAQASTKFAKELLSNDVLPCAKHFPGHGDTKVDSHFGLPVVQLGLDELRQRELIPFQELIDMGIPLVMTAHILFPKLDQIDQATVSRKILNDILRRDMGFKQVIIADALGMKAIAAEQYETTVKSLNAGLDLFLVAGDNVNLESAVRIANHMRDALAKKEVTEDVIASSLNRIDALAQRLPQHAVEELDAEVFEEHQRLADKCAEREAWSAFELRVPGFE